MGVICIKMLFIELVGQRQHIYKEVFNQDARINPSIKR